MWATPWQRLIDKSMIPREGEKCKHTVQNRPTP
nr:MAG TPA: hypothetical protein [Bacteriophage sp.]